MKLCRITRVEGMVMGEDGIHPCEKIRVDWIFEERDGSFTQKHIGPKNDAEVNVAVVILETFGFKLVDDFDEVSTKILKKAGCEIVK